ncbi:Type cbb3 cytochrome oxidase biogenesis protein CcoI; Copper-translocating P-type ATPase [hydrothermal vent metagenome]|uniref:Type cbb3 cytochrome oxidase biogenesis protein CcoI Copper-translocating P-type ATPase n=1 Tax=hydrothermal vent metagenome TaxID=652676 RepID=A0A3B0VAK5_9ZZZZ
MPAQSCFHCHEELPNNVKITASIEGKNQHVCCYGCKAVAEFINQQGYSEFYDFRGNSQPASKAQISDSKWQQYDEAVTFATYARQTSEHMYHVTIRLEGMYCSACGWLIDKHLRGLLGITEVKLNTITKLLQVEFDKSKIALSQILSAINYLGYQPILSKDKNTQQQSISERKDALKRLVVAGFGMMFIMTVSVPLYSGEYKGIDANIKRFFELISLLAATYVYFYSGITFLKNAYRDLSNKHLGMDVPVALSISLAYWASTYNVLSANAATIYFDSMVMFVFFLLAGRFVEMSVRHQGMSANDALSSMIPSSVKLLQGTTIKTIPYDQITKGDIIEIATGEVVAIDGEIIAGDASIDESMITGESKSIAKTIGDTVMAGSNIDAGTIKIKSTAIGEETILASLSNLLESAQLQKPKTLLLIDKIAGWFVAIVLLLAILTAIYYSIYQADMALITVIALLVATCPCALSLATPVALTAGSVRLMKSGVLVNNLDAITKVNKIKNWFFDKTGTLTEPYMSLVKTHNFSNKADTQIIKIMAALEHNSSHPIASAFNDFFDNNIKISDFREESSQGIKASIGRHTYKAGTKQWCDKDSEINIDTPHTIIYLSQNNQLIAAFELENQLRQGSKQLIKYLQNNHHDISIISGDKTTAVAAIAATLNIKNYYSKHNPEQKINLIHQQQAQLKTTIMLGDGINDAPVLAQSDVSISFNQGTQLARAASDFIIMGSSLTSVQSLLTISQKTNNIIKQNIIWSLVYNLSVTPLAIMGYLAPWMAAIGMSLSSLFVVLNAKRILLIKTKNINLP